MSELETRAAELVGVSYPKRQIELVVMPWETPTDVDYHGRTITEIVTRGAFGNGIAGRKNIRVNRDHDVKRVVGRAVKFHPSHSDGLVAELHISDTQLGEETLKLADDGVLDASAGFALLEVDRQTGEVHKDAEVWETSSRRRLNHLFLDHIAMTPNPAYEDARVLAVRNIPDAVSARYDASQGPSRPNLELLEVLRLRELAADMDRRYAAGQH